MWEASEKICPFFFLSFLIIIKKIRIFLLVFRLFFSFLIVINLDMIFLKIWFPVQHLIYAHNLITLIHKKSRRSYCTWINLKFYNSSKCTN